MRDPLRWSKYINEGRLRAALGYPVGSAVPARGGGLYLNEYGTPSTGVAGAGQEAVAGGDGGNEVSLLTVVLSPSAAYRVTDWLSVGASPGPASFPAALPAAARAAATAAPTAGFQRTATGSGG